MYPNVVAPPVKINLNNVILGPAKNNVECPVPKVLNDLTGAFKIIRLLPVALNLEYNNPNVLLPTSRILRLYCREHPGPK